MLQVSLFGRLAIQVGSRSTTESFSHYKAVELLCYLLLHRTQAQVRETLATLLWSEASTQQSRKYLRKAIWQLQAALGEMDDEGARCLVSVEPEWIALNTRADVWLDVAIFEAAFEQTRATAGSALDARGAQLLRDAAALYRGDLLEGWYQDWCIFERERLQNQYFMMLDKLMLFCETNGECEAGIAYGAALLRYDRAHERTYRRLMRLHYLMGDRSAALQQYARCVAALERELGVPPSEQTTELYRQLCRDQLEAAPPASQPVALIPIDSDPLDDALHRTRQIHDGVQILLDHVRHLVVALEKITR